MKKLLLVMTVVGFVACNNSSDSTATSADSAVKAVTDSAVNKVENAASAVVDSAAQKIDSAAKAVVDSVKK